LKGVLVAVAIFAVASRLTAQPRIRVDTIAAINSSGAHGVDLTEHSTVARDSLGHYLVSLMPGPGVAIYDSLGRFVRMLSYSTRPNSVARSITPYTLDARASEIQVFDGSFIAFFTETGVPRAPHARVPAGFTVAQTTGRDWTYLVTAPSDAPHALGYLTVQHNEQLPATFTVLDTVKSSPRCDNCSDLLIESGLRGLAKGDLLFAVADQYRIELFTDWGATRTRAIDISRPWLPTLTASHYVAGRTIPEAPRLTSIRLDRPCEATRPPQQCMGKLWVAGLVMADSTQSDPNRRYATMIDVFEGVTHDMHMSHAAELRLRGQVEMFGRALAFQRDRDADGNWRLTIMRFSVVGG
jgi:hypothetical protein